MTFGMCLDFCHHLHGLLVLRVYLLFHTHDNERTTVKREEYKQKHFTRIFTLERTLANGTAVGALTRRRNTLITS